MSDLDELLRAGRIRKRLRGGYTPTRQGRRYLRDVILRDEELRAEMGKQIELFEAGELSEDGRREALVDIIRRAWERDGAGEAEALAVLRTKGLDPIATLVEGRGSRAEKARHREAEEFITVAFQHAEVPVLLFDAYADAIERHGLSGWRLSDDHPTTAETNATARASYRDMVEAMSAYVFKGGRARWAAFTQAAYDFGPAGVYGVLNARDALYASNVGFSEFTDPAFVGRVEPSEENA